MSLVRVFCSPGAGTAGGTEEARLSTGPGSGSGSGPGPRSSPPRTHVHNTYKGSHFKTRRLDTGPPLQLIPTRTVCPGRPAAQSGRARRAERPRRVSAPPRPPCSVRDAPGGPKAPEKYRQISALHALCQRTESLTSRSPPPPRRHLRDRQIEVLRGDRGSPPEHRDRIRATAASDRAQHPRHVQHPGQSQPNLQHHGQKPPLHCPLPELRGTAAGRPARPGPGTRGGGLSIIRSPRPLTAHQLSGAGALVAADQARAQIDP